MGYKEVYDAWQADPEGFWMDAAKAIDWDKPPSKALSDKGDGLYEWFADGMVNTCWNAVDRHVEAGRGDQVAIIYDSPITGRQAKITYGELQGAGRDVRRRPRPARDHQGRPRHHLHADGARGADRHAGLRPDRRDPLGGVRRLRGA